MRARESRLSLEAAPEVIAATKISVAQGSDGGAR
jgi:hypothetical protein